MNAPLISLFLPLILLPLFLQYLVITLAISNNINTDKDALLAIKDSIKTDTASSLLKGNWSSKSNVCEWIGISCSTRHHRVTGLDISNMGLQGQVAQQIGNLSFLISINMSFNSFRGDLPQEMGRLRRLRYLDLESNNFVGIPSSIGYLQNLKHLQMYGNQLKLTIPNSLFNISTLEYLNLGNNSIPGSLPANMCDKLNRLEYLNIISNKLEGNIPTTIARCFSLKVLSLGLNHLSGFIPKDIANLTNLVVLSLRINMLSGGIPSGVFNLPSLKLLLLQLNEFSGTLPIMRLPNLEELILSQNYYLQGPIPSSISNSSKLRLIYLNENNFSGQIPNSIGSLRYLQHMRLHINNFTNESTELSIITSLTNCKQLVELTLQKNPLGGTLPASIGNLSTSLEKLYLNDIKLKGNIPKELGHLKNLRTLLLNGNDFSGTIPSTFQNLQNLQSFSVSRNNLSGNFPNVICKLKKLFGMYMASNKFSGPLPNCLGDMISLREVNLYNNMFSNIPPESLWNMKYLLYLNVSKNHFNGTLSAKMTNMEALITCDLSRNEFRGNIPSGVGELMSLVTLSLAENRLEGAVPESFGKIPLLEFLNLSANNLSGVIPKSLESLDTLKYFNVSFNKLGGEIPSEGPFRNFTQESFMSNDGFCGGAPPLNFPACPSNSLPKPASRKGSKVFIIIFSPLAMIALILSIAIYVWVTKFRIRRPQTRPEPSLDPNFIRISYLELHRATDGFSESNLLGKGSFGSVYRATLPSGDIYAVKVFHIQHEGAYKSFDQECEILRNIRHRNLVKVISSCVNLDFKSLVLQYMPNGSLENWLYGDNYHLDFIQRLNVMIDVAYALEHLHCGHSSPVVHCDLKPSNVLLDIEMVGYVTDFGISKLLDEDESFVHTKTLATFGYMAPEYGMEGMVSTMCDVYSFGIMLMEVFTRKMPSNEMFQDDLNIRSWVLASATNDNLIAIIDEDIVKEEEEHLNKKLKALSSIVELALNCSQESPQARFNVIEIVATLKRIKALFLKVDN